MERGLSDGSRQGQAASCFRQVYESPINLMDAIPLCDRIEVYIYIYVYTQQ